MDVDNLELNDFEDELTDTLTDIKTNEYVDAKAMYDLYISDEQITVTYEKNGNFDSTVHIDTKDGNQYSIGVESTSGL